MRLATLIIMAISFIALSASTKARANDASLFGGTLGTTVGGVLATQLGQASEQVALVGVGAGVDAIAAQQTTRSNISYTDGTETHYGIFSDPPSTSYDAYRPNYVAPPAPPPTYIDPTAQTYCRKYSRRSKVTGHMQENYGTACLQQDGSWRVVQ